MPHKCYKCGGSCRVDIPIRDTYADSREVKCDACTDGQCDCAERRWTCGDGDLFVLKLAAEMHAIQIGEPITIIKRECTRCGAEVSA